MGLEERGGGARGEGRQDYRRVEAWLEERGGVAGGERRGEVGLEERGGGARVEGGRTTGEGRCG